RRQSTSGRPRRSRRSLPPPPPSLTRQLAKAFWAVGAGKAAITIMQEALAKLPASSPAVVRRAACAFAVGSWLSALRAENPTVIDAEYFKRGAADVNVRDTV